MNPRMRWNVLAVVLQVTISFASLPPPPFSSYLPPSRDSVVIAVGTPAISVDLHGTKLIHMFLPALPAIDIFPVASPPAGQQDPSTPQDPSSSGRLPEEDGCPSICPFDYNPVCGSDGVVYTNNCTFSVAQCKNPRLTLLNVGRCASPPSGGSLPPPPAVPNPFPPPGGSFPPPPAVPNPFPPPGGSFPPPPAVPNPFPPPVPNPFPVFEAPLDPTPGSGVIPFPPSMSTLGGVEDPPTFEGPQSPSGGCNEACTKIFIPLCGTDGVTYNNLCLLELAACQGAFEGFTLDVAHDGACRDQQPSLVDSVNIRTQSLSAATQSSTLPLPCDEQCTKIFTPVCGSDGRNYNNHCLLDVASCQSAQGGGGYITLEYEGKCRKSGITAADDIDAAFSAALTSPEPCPEFCVKTFLPVCGSDDQTYNNDCLLNVAACKGRSIGAETLFKAFDGPCVAALPRGPTCNHACDKTSNPVCGSNGETYNNMCLLNLADCLHPFVDITFASDGACRIVAPAGQSLNPRPGISTDHRPNVDVELGSLHSDTQTSSGAFEREYVPPV